MVSGIQANLGQQYVGAAGNPVYVAQAPAFQYAPAADSVEITGKKKSGAKKAIFGTLATVAVAAATLFGLVKTGKLTKVENPSKWTEKLQNVAFNAGDWLVKGYESAKKTDFAQKAKDKLSGCWDWIKSKFGKSEAA